ncbi:hypothetical protein TNCV_4700651 [Trichonephila clavipes]|nr:hypothetical protein TNCV_4700651 [Trichonephila clavipes]
MHDRMFPALYGPLLIRKMIGCCPDLHVHQISHQKKSLIYGCQVTTYHNMPVTMVDVLWHHVQSAWASVHVNDIQSLFDAMPRCVSAVITARGDHSG